MLRNITEYFGYNIHKTNNKPPETGKQEKEIHGEEYCLA